jgi:hypothetical protein
VIPSDRQAPVTARKNTYSQDADKKAMKQDKHVKAVADKQVCELKNRPHETAQNVPGTKKRKSAAAGAR